MYRFLFQNMTGCLLIVRSLGGNICFLIGKQTDGSVPKFRLAALS